MSADPDRVTELFEQLSDLLSGEPGNVQELVLTNAVAMLASSVMTSQGVDPRALIAHMTKHALVLCADRLKEAGISWDRPN